MTDAKPPVKCVDCGYLSQRVETPIGNPYGDGKFVPPPEQPMYREVPKEQRNRGTPEPRFMGEQVWFECLAAAWDLGSELPKENDDLSVWKRIIKKERGCSQFTTYVLGHTPKEHVMMQLRKEQDEREDKRDQNQHEREDRRDKRNLRFRLGEAFLVVATIVAIIVAARWQPTQTIEIRPPVPTAAGVAASPAPMQPEQ